MVVAAAECGRSWEYRIKTGKLLSSLLTAHLERILDSLGWRACDIDLFCCGRGPGSFTGVRIGMATVKALAWACSKPVAGVSSLEVISRNVRERPCLVVPAVDAKRGMIYCAVYRREAEAGANAGKHRQVLSERLLTANEFSSTIKKIARAYQGPVYLTGDALAGPAVGISAGLGRNVSPLDRDSWYPSARALIEAAGEKAASKRQSDALSIQPLYLYPQECQIRRSQKHVDR
jgi:tRNA threonylcarbamoyladenosine biosynthesis protein TsaB